MVTKKENVMHLGAVLLPAPARMRLQQAALTPNTESDPVAKLKAVEKAIDWVKINYPRFFKDDCCSGE